MATPDQVPSDLTLEIAENLSPDGFLAAARAFFGYVDEVARSALPEADRPTWIVQLREGSHLVGLDPMPGVPLDAVKAVYAQVESRFHMLANGPVSGSGLSETALKHLKALSELAEGVKRKPVAVRLWVCKRPLVLEPALAQAIRADWRADYSDYGTLEGRLEAIQDRGGIQLRLRDAALRQTVNCFVAEDMLAEIFTCFRKRVEVSGSIRYRRNGTPVSIDVSRIDLLPDEADLPSIDDVMGILRIDA